MKDAIDVPATDIRSVDLTPADWAAMQAKIAAIIAAQAMIDPAALTAQGKLADLGLDSLAMVEIVFALEETFAITVPFNANTKSAEFDFTTIASIAAATRRLQCGA